MMMAGGRMAPGASTSGKSPSVVIVVSCCGRLAWRTMATGVSPGLP
jgi:hypothetical protein